MVNRENKKEALLWITIITTCIFVLWMLGPEGYILESDSGSYYPIAQKEGVMLLYPIFLELINKIFGEKFYLDAAVIIQVLIASICTINFMFFIRKQFHLNHLESYLVLLFALFPFTITYPDYIITHTIMTEALSYAFFYPYVKHMMKSIFFLSKKDSWIQLFWAFVLSMTRSQLRLVWVISVAVLFCVGIKKLLINRAQKKFFLITILTISVSVIFILGVFSVTLADSTLRNFLFNREVLIENTEQPSVDLKETEVVEKVEKPTENKNEKKKENNQRNSALMARIIYVSDKKDANLFQNKEMKGAFLSVYNAVDKEKHRYPYAERNLWEWKHIAEACAVNPSLAWKAISDYYGTLYENPAVAEQKTVEAYAEIANTLLKKHWDKYIGSTFTFLPSGFICTVFFQKEDIYLLCHIITLVLYLLAIAGSVICLKNKYGDKRVAEFMLLVLVISFSFVIITNLVFMGLQRYLIYPFGIFYIALYVLYKEIMRKKLWKKF